MARLLLFLMKCILGLLATLGLFLVLALVGGWLFWEEVKEWQGAGPEELPERRRLQRELAATGQRKVSSRSPASTPPPASGW